MYFGIILIFSHFSVYVVHDIDRHILIFSHFSVYVVHDIDCHILIFSHFSVYVVHRHWMWAHTLSVLCWTVFHCSSTCFVVLII